tara:strand:+ start:126 stop:659 length:534 start_codon:yes stop_codon:yes gene_type:complete
MSALALVTFIEIYDPEEVPASGNISGAIQHRFQNSEPTSSGITFNGARFDFLSFLYQGATRSKDGNNLESTLILANESNDREGSVGTNKLSMSYAAEAVDKGWSVRVSTCEMTDLTFSSVKTTIVVDTWKIASMGYDNTSIEILLTSTIDAVKGNIGRFLTSSLVGHLPVTASMRTR